MFGLVVALDEVHNVTSGYTFFPLYVLIGSIGL